MSADYPNAAWVPIPGFGYDPQGSHGREGHSAKWVIVHKTASPNATAQNIATYFQGDPNNGTHFVIGRDGTVIQMVALADAAYGNAPVNPASHDAFWDSIGALNPNFVTVSIEHCTTTSDNSDPLTPEQQQASFQLIAWLCKTLNIPARPADANGGVTGHYSLDGINRAHCPGNYPFDALYQYLGGAMSGIPEGWKESDDHSQLIAPNGHYFERGFKAAVEAMDWSADDWPLEEERSVAALEITGDNAVPGVIQTTRKNRWLYSPDKNNGQPFLSYTGAVLLLTEQALASANAEIAQLKAAPAQPPASDLQQRLDEANAALADAQQQLKLLTEQEPADPVALQQRQVAAMETVARAVVLLVPPSERAKLTS